jgi:hypothetical protein
MMPFRKKTWTVEGISEDTKAKIRAYKALAKKKTLPQALDEMADIALASLRKK